MAFESTPSSSKDYSSSIEHNISRLDELRTTREFKVVFGVVDTEVPIPHDLGVVPKTRWVVTYQDIAGSVYEGDTAWTDANAYLKCNVANLVAVVRFELPGK